MAGNSYFSTTEAFLSLVEESGSPSLSKNVARAGSKSFVWINIFSYNGWVRGAKEGNVSVLEEAYENSSEG